MTADAKFKEKGTTLSYKTGDSANQHHPRNTVRADHPRKQVGPASHAHPATAGVFAGLLPELRRAVAEEGYTTPTPIQEPAIPHLLEGRDLIGCAQTGTGKTAAFTLPMLQYLTAHKRQPARGRPRVLILAPTRELAAQIGDSAATYGRHLRVTHTVIFGGVGQHPQVARPEPRRRHPGGHAGPAARPHAAGAMHLDAVEIFVLDEADRMLDMGFIPDIRRSSPSCPPGASRCSSPPPWARGRGAGPHAGRMTRARDHRPEAAGRGAHRAEGAVRGQEGQGRPAGRAARRFPLGPRARLHPDEARGQQGGQEAGRGAGIPAAAIHGNKSQSARTEALASFKAGRIRVLVATDIAARGIDVDGITHVINYDLPVEPETYVHRIGRTARAGAGGDAVSFCSADERDFLRSIERLIRLQVPVDASHAFHSETARRASGIDSRPKAKAPHAGNDGQRNRSFRATAGKGRTQTRKPADHWKRRH